MSSPEASGPPTTGAAAPDAEARRRRTIRFFVVLGGAALVAVAAILIAVALSQPSGTSSSTSTTSGTSASAIKAQLPQLAIGPPTFAWLYAASVAMRETMEPDFGPSIRVPILMIVAGLDRVVSLKAIEAVAAELRVGGQVAIAGARHEVLMERDIIREQFWAAFDAFIPGTAG